MAFTHGKNSAFKLDDSGGTLRVLSTYVDSVDGLPSERELADVTVFGAAGHNFIPGLANAQFSIHGFYDSTATTGPDVVIGGLLTGQTTTATFEYGPEGSTTGKVRYTGECWVKKYDAKAAVANAVEYTADFQVDGAVTKNTFP